MGRISFDPITDTVRRVGRTRLVVISGPPFRLPADGARRPESTGQSFDAEGGRSETTPGNHASRVAAELDTHVVAGPTVELSGGGHFIVAHVWGRDGALVGVQRQTHLSRVESESGFVRGDEISVFDIGGMSLGVVVGSDAWHPEVGRIMALRGVDLVAAVGVGGAFAEVTPEDGIRDDNRRNSAASGGHRWGGIDALWAQVQENQFWAVATGASSAVLAPCGITAGMTGYLSCGRAVDVGTHSVDLGELDDDAHSVDLGELDDDTHSVDLGELDDDARSFGVGELDDEACSIAVGELDEEARDRLIARYPLLDLLNPVAYRRYLPAFYARGAEETSR